MTALSSPSSAEIAAATEPVVEIRNLVKSYRRGDQVVAFHRLRLLSAYHEISLLSFYEHASELSGLERLEPFCKSLTTVRLHRGSALGRAVIQSRSGLPFQVLYYNSREFRDRLEGLVAKEAGGLAACIHVDFEQRRRARCTFCDACHGQRGRVGE